MKPQCVTSARKTRLALQPLEERCTPALALFTYTDTDGDLVKITTSKPGIVAPPLDMADVTLTAAGDLQKLDLTDSGFEGATIVINAIQQAGGDGFANVWRIDASNINLGRVTVDGDLGRIQAGNATPGKFGLRGLTVQSLGASSGAANLGTVVKGKLGFLRVNGHMDQAMVEVQGGTEGKIGSVFIGGSLIGLAGGYSGRIRSFGDMGPVTIVGDVIGGDGMYSGEVRSHGKLARVKVGGSVIGGTADYSGRIEADDGIGFVTIGGDLNGFAGEHSGEVHSDHDMAGIKVGGSVVGGTNTGSGAIKVNGKLGSVNIAGDLIGGSGESAGKVHTSGKLSNLRIGGDVRGGTGHQSGHIRVSNVIGTIFIGGSLIGGDASGFDDLEESGYITADRIAKLTIGGSLRAGNDNTSGNFVNNGAIRVGNDLGTVLIKGNIVGYYGNPAIISARGKEAPTSTSDVAIGSLRVLGAVVSAQILAGVDIDGLAKNADAQIGTVFVGSNWTDSSLAAGAVPGANGYGDGDFKVLGAGVKDESGVLSTIGSLTINGQVNTYGLGVYTGIVAEKVVAVKIDGTSLVLQAGDGNDDVSLPGIVEFKVHEV